MKIKFKRKINAPAGQIWPIIADFSNINKFHPFLKGAEFVNDSSSCEIGSARQCDFKDGTSVKETITEWVEGSHYTIEMSDITMPMKSGTGTVGVRELDSNASEAYMIMDIKLKKPIMQPMMYLMFRYNMGPKILKGLDEYYQRTTGIAATA